MTARCQHPEASRARWPCPLDDGTHSELEVCTDCGARRRDESEWILPRRTERTQRSIDDALQHLETARPALKWVRNHAPRHDAHDQSHAELALKQVLAAIEVLRR